MPKAGSDFIFRVQGLNRAIDLVVLDDCVYEKTEVVETKSNDLNRVFEA
jgi:hypothetical protein